MSASTPATSTSIRWRRPSRRVPARIMPVHFAGLPVDMDRLYAIADRAPAARHRGCRAGHRLRLARPADRQLRRPGVLQLPPQQEHHHHRGGRVSGGSPEELKAIELHRWHGQSKTGADGFDTLFAGGKSNLSDVAAAVGLGQLRRLEDFNARRRALAARYFELWGQDAPCACRSAAMRGTTGTCSRRCCRWRSCASRAPQFMEQMEARGIGVGVHYPAIHLFSGLSRAGLPRRAVPERRAHRPRNRDAAAVPGDGARPTSTAWSTATNAILARSAPMNPDALGRHPGLQRGGGPGAAVRAALPGAGCTRAHLRGGIRRRRQHRPLGRRCCASSSSSARTSRG